LTKRYVKIFKSFEEMEAHSFEIARQTTPEQRLRKLYYMQKFTLALRPKSKERKKIEITRGDL
jgi:hypothetical protein